MPPIHEQLDWSKDTDLTQEQIICLGRCANPTQFWSMADAFTKGKCPFCDREYLDGEVLVEGEHWYAFKPPGAFDRQGSKLRYKLVIPFKGHTADPADVPGSAMAEMWLIRRQALEIMGVAENEGGGLYLRHGSALYNACTVPGHLHWNDDGPSGHGEVRPPIYKTEEGWKKDHDRFVKYWSIYDPSMAREAYVATYAARYEA